MSGEELGFTEVTALEAQARAEIDIQISTAKKYPRVVAKSVATAVATVTRTRDVAEKCHYSLPRGRDPIEGPSIRLAEVVGSTWGNLRIAVRVTEEGQRFVTAQAACHDLESNIAEVREVRRRITKRDGSRYDDDMIGVTMAAAMSIAKRNVILAVVPQLAWGEVYAAAMELLLNGKEDLGQIRRQAIAWFAGFGVDEGDVLAKVGCRKIGDLTRQKLVTLGGLKTAIEQGTTTIDDEFEVSPEKVKKARAKAKPVERPVEKPKEEVKKEAAPVDHGTGTPVEEPAATTVSDEKMALWQAWVRLRSTMTPEQLAKVKEISGVEKITRRLTEENLTNVLDVGRTVVAETGE